MTIEYIENYNDNRKVTLSIEEIMQRIGPEATQLEAEEFVRVWNIRFYDSGAPVFYDKEDLEATWAETVTLL